MNYIDFQVEPSGERHGDITRIIEQMPPGKAFVFEHANHATVRRIASSAQRRFSGRIYTCMGKIGGPIKVGRVK